MNVQILFCLLLGVACAGCSSSDNTEVYGKVTFNGAPLADGDIVFEPTVPSAGSLASTVIKDGEYRMAGEWALQPGTYRVKINGYRPSTNKETMLAGGHLDMPPETPGIPRKDQFLSKKFNAATTLENVTVAKGDGSVERNFDLKE